MTDRALAPPPPADGTDPAWYRRALQRDPKGAPLAGVIAAIATAYGFDPRLTRIATVAITLVLPVTILVYIVAWLVIPAAPTPGESAEALITDRRRRPIYIALAVVALLGGVGGVGGRPGIDLWPGSVALLALFALLVVLLALLGRRWIPLLLLVPLVALGAWYFVAEPTVSGGWGNRTIGANEISVDSADALATRLAGGRLRIDLRDLGADDLPTSVTAAVGAGTLEVLVPPGVELRVASFVGTGVIRLNGEQLAAGVRQRTATLRSGSEPTLVLDLRIGVGVIEISR